MFTIFRKLIQYFYYYCYYVIVFIVSSIIYTFISSKKKMVLQTFERRVHVVLSEEITISTFVCQTSTKFVHTVVLYYHTCVCVKKECYRIRNVIVRYRCSNDDVDVNTRRAKITSEHRSVIILELLI